MASTTHLKLVKNVSEADMQKIAVINTEMDDLDFALGGMLNLSVAGSSNVTLTRLQALNPRMKFTGVLTGNIAIFIPVIANGAITPPTTTIGALANFWVWNATTGAFTITIKTSAVGSTGETITQTKKAWFSHDGTNAFKTTTEV